MSIVALRVEKERITIGADSITVCGWTQNKDQDAKLQEVSPGFVIGGAGQARQNALLFQYAQTHMPEGSGYMEMVRFFQEYHAWYRTIIGETAAQLDNQFLVVFGGRAFYLNAYFVKEIRDYYAIGAGMDYALAALYLGSTVEKSIEAACELSIVCEKPIKIIHVKI